jgi:transposase InsO family protein
MSHAIEELVRTCDACQRFKKQKKKYGHLPVRPFRDVEPWEVVAVDLIGPYTVHTANRTLRLLALTIMDMATRWVEIAPIETKNADVVALAFDRTWLARYPRPREVIHDNGTEFSTEFLELLDSYGIQSKCTTVKNPQANSTLERMHQVLGNNLRTLELENRRLDDVDPFAGVIANTAFALRATIHTTLEASPAQLVYGRDMIIHTQFVADWARIRDRQRQLTVRDNARENKTRHRHHYRVGDRVLIRRDEIGPKMRIPTHGPYTITQISQPFNGTVTILRRGYFETINIRRLIPYYPRG